MIDLSRIVTVPPREIWNYEATAFTPWLARPENIALLAEALQLEELEVEATEHDVGRFSADIVARDNSGTMVLIENQLEATDHRHLGQVLTYLAGLEGDATVVWIATHFHEEHRAAVDWLNTNTNERFDFMGVEIEVLKIGDSPPAPRFSIVAKPNGWSRRITALSRRAFDGELSDGHKLRIGYWSSFAEFLKDHGGSFKIRRTNKDSWHHFPIGRSTVGILANISSEKRRIGVELYLFRDDDKNGFRTLAAERQQIEAEFGEPLEWLELPGKRASRIVTYREGVDLTNASTFPDLHGWMLDRMQRMKTVFADRVRRIDFAGDTGLSDEPDGP